MNNTQPDCKGCEHQNRCEDVYRALGASDAPPVVGRVLLAFAIPMVLFVLTLAVSEWMLSETVHPGLTSLIGVALATGVTLLYAVMVRWVMRRASA